jgi:hypothetical protein
MTLLSNCTSYKPIIDTAGRSGTFPESKAVEVTNDVQHCRTLAKEHTNGVVESYKVIHNWYLRPQTLWLMPKLEYTERKLIRNCLEKRGHAVLND